jgi:hypothetical protein
LAFDCRPTLATSTGSGSATVTLLPGSGGAEHTMYAVDGTGITVAVPLGLTRAGDPTLTPSPTNEAARTPWSRLPLAG